MTAALTYAVAAALLLSILPATAALAEAPERQEQAPRKHEAAGEKKQMKGEGDVEGEGEGEGEAPAPHKHPSHPKHEKSHEHAKPNAKTHQGHAKGKHPGTTQPAPVVVKTEHLPLAVGIDGGWEATYGNALTLTYFPWEDLGFTIAAGYNNSGVKLGAGAEVLLPLHQSFGLRFLGAFVESLGKKGEVSLDASFIPANSTTAEPIVATKRYELTPATMLSAAAGGYFNLDASIRFALMLDYNYVLSGNQVTFEGKTSYDKQVQVTNGPDFGPQFNDKAQSVVKAGGFGAYMGVQFLF